MRALRGLPAPGGGVPSSRGPDAAATYDVTYSRSVLQRLHAVGAGPQRVRALRGLQAPGGGVTPAGHPYTAAAAATHDALDALRYK